MANTWLKVGFWLNVLLYKDLVLRAKVFNGSVGRQTLAASSVKMVKDKG